MLILLVLLDGEVYLIPFVGRRDVTGDIRGDIFPVGTITLLFTLHSEEEVRAGFILLRSRVSYIAGEVHTLTLTQSRIEVQGSHLSGRGHTVTVNHISVLLTAVLLHLIPVVAIVNEVNQSILTHVWQIGCKIIMESVAR